MSASTPDYKTTLAAARKAGASHADDAGQIALLCATTVQHTVGAVSPSLVFEGAMKKKLTASAFARLIGRDPRAVEALMWA